MPADQVFSGTYSYPAGDGFAAGEGVWSTTAGGTWTSPDVPAGAVVTVQENAADAVGNAKWGTPVVSDPVTVKVGETAKFTVDNPITIDKGAFSVTKSVSGDGAGLVPADQVFSGTYSYPAGDGFAAGEGVWSTTAGGTWTSPDVPAGAVVTVQENAADAVGNAKWGTPVVSDPVTVKVGETAKFTVENPISLVPSEPGTTPPAQNVPDDKGPGSLARTGLAAGSILAGALVLIAGSLGLIAAARRRRQG
ncbi:hypothetical protein F8O06_11510 [Pseudoclavibacter sp. CFCC 14310]|nr:hypothetical protein F8O06_11510 [Pseudoclavibacter sp. CFCC 14310]